MIDFVGQEQHVGPKEIALGFHVQGVKEREVALMWHHVHVKSQQSTLNKYSPQFEKPILKLGSNFEFESKAARSNGVTHYLDYYLNVYPTLSFHIMKTMGLNHSLGLDQIFIRLALPLPHLHHCLISPMLPACTCMGSLPHWEPILNINQSSKQFELSLKSCQVQTSKFSKIASSSFRVQIRKLKTKELVFLNISSKIGSSNQDKLILFITFFPTQEQS